MPTSAPVLHNHLTAGFRLPPAIPLAIGDPAMSLKASPLSCLDAEARGAGRASRLATTNDIKKAAVR
ncbi:hypothetical protein [Consotaella aegiceratis]|uniref:hypothetical protein n=1 Tax=Consotaella aegiceratis TaxID=3097961 RepID=UPI002F3E68DF